jgi:ABC-type uncharacterized transport system permease subunit
VKAVITDTETGIGIRFLQESSMGIEAIRNGVAEGETVGASVSTLLGKVAGTILDNLHNPTKLKEFANELLQGQGQIITAVVTGTAAEDEEPAEAEESDAKTSKRRKRDE